MLVNIRVVQTVDIPNGELLALADAVRKKWGQEKWSAVHAEDLLNEAERMGLVKLPPQWRTEDEFFTDRELREASNV